MSDKSVKKKILDAITFVRKDMGYTLVCEDWGDPTHKCACAMSAVILKDDSSNLPRATDKNSIQTAADILGVSIRWIEEFISGFDSNGSAKDSMLPEAWTIGQEVAKETKPIVYHEWDGESDG